MVDSRQKGARAEYQVRDLFREHTGHEWERTPMSGALSYLKTDIYIPHCENNFAVEVKHYEEPILDIKILTNKSSKFTTFFNKVYEQAQERNQEPILVFKHNRSKFYVATQVPPEHITTYLYIKWLDCYVMLLEEWLEKEPQEWKYG